MNYLLPVALLVLLIIGFFAGAMIVAAIEVDQEQKEYLEGDPDNNRLSDEYSEA